jgi:hypothetical protein
MSSSRPSRGANGVGGGGGGDLRSSDNGKARMLSDPQLKLRVGYLASILNNPNEDSNTLSSWGAFLGLTGETPPPDEPPPLAPGVLPEVGLHSC